MKKIGLVILTILIVVFSVFYLYHDSNQVETIINFIDRSFEQLNIKYAETFDIQQEPEKNRTMKILLNGETEFSFVNAPKYDGMLWLPASEIMRLFDYRSPAIKDSIVGCGHFDEQGKYLFAFFQAGSYGFSIDADASDFITAFKKPYYQDGEIYVPESSMETLTGDVFTYDADSNTLIIKHESATGLQQSNHNPLWKIVPKTSGELHDNRIVQEIYPLDEYVSFWKADDFTSPQDRFAGWKWLHVSLETANWQESNPELSDFYTNDDIERFFQVVDEYGMYISYDLTFKDKDFKRTGGSLVQDNLHDPQQVERYLAFVEEVVTHYRGVVDDYQLWNNPNSMEEPSYVAIDDYLAVLQLAAPLIKSIEPQATISIGYTTPDYQDMSWPYLEALVSSETVQLADHIAFPPLYNVSPEHFPDFYYNYANYATGLMEKARQNGFQGDFWISGGDYRPREYGLTVVDNFDTYTEAIAAKYLQRINAINLGIGLTGGTMGTLESPFSYDALSRTSMLYSGVQASDTEISIQSDMQPVRGYSYDVDMGKLFSYWYDGPASEISQSGSADLLLDVSTCHHVYAYDIYNGFYQELDFQFQDGMLSLDDVIIQDYPMFILLD